MLFEQPSCYYRLKMQLGDNIRAYYFDHSDELNAESQFHFCTRLAAWTGDPTAKQRLTQLRSRLVPKPCTTETLAASLQTLLARAPGAQVNAASLRQPYFARHPSLFGLELALFRVRHLRFVYGVDALPALLTLVPQQALLDLHGRLLADDEAVRALSTYVVNYTCLLELLLQPDAPKAATLEHFYTLGHSYEHELGNPDYLPLLVYLYTHCIIAAGNFYTQPLPPPLLPVARRMLARLETVLTKHFADLSLDTKLEFLVCCRMCDFKTLLKEKIDSECQTSVSPEGTFLIDTHNSLARTSRKKSFAASEHRNVLYIMSRLPYRPHSTLIDD
jgi:hypothetical protein